MQGGERRAGGLRLRVVRGACSWVVAWGVRVAWSVAWLLARQQGHFGGGGCTGMCGGELRRVTIWERSAGKSRMQRERNVSYDNGRTVGRWYRYK